MNINRKFKHSNNENIKKNKNKNRCYIAPPFKPLPFAPVSRACPERHLGFTGFNHGSGRVLLEFGDPTGQHGGMPSALILCLSCLYEELTNADALVKAERLSF